MKYFLMFLPSQLAAWTLFLLSMRQGEDLVTNQQRQNIFFSFILVNFSSTCILFFIVLYNGEKYCFEVFR